MTNTANSVGIGAADEPKAADPAVIELVEALEKIVSRTTLHFDDTVEDTAKDALKANAIARAALAKYATQQGGGEHV